MVETIKAKASKSPVTTWGGVIAALGALILAVGEATGNDAVKAAGATVGGIGTLVLGMGARDHGVTSEQAGAAPKDGAK